MAGMAATQDPLVGQVLNGKYRIIRLIGRGGMGAVYLAEHQKLGRRCAIKFIRIGGLAIAEPILQRFYNEAKIMAQLKVRGCVEMYDLDEYSDGTPFIVME